MSYIFKKKTLKGLIRYVRNDEPQICQVLFPNVWQRFPLAKVGLGFAKGSFCQLQKSKPQFDLYFWRSIPPKTRPKLQAKQGAPFGFYIYPRHPGEYLLRYIFGVQSVIPNLRSSVGRLTSMGKHIYFFKCGLTLLFLHWLVNILRCAITFHDLPIPSEHDPPSYHLLERLGSGTKPRLADGCFPQ